MNIESASVKLNTDLDKIGNTADSFTATGMSATTTVQNLHVRLPEIIDRYESVVASADQMLDCDSRFLRPLQQRFPPDRGQSEPRYRKSARSGSGYSRSNPRVIG